MPATSGHTSGKPFATYDRGSQSWKTFQDISLWGSTEFSGTWPKTGYMSDGHAYEHPKSEHHTIDSAYSSQYLPTPTASDCKRDDSNADNQRKSPGITSCRTHFPDLADDNNYTPTTP